MKTRTRFAPSPTGRMHVGNLRTALYSYLIAKHDKGDFILRIEDTDRERYFEEALDIIYKTLEETNLCYDEGPDKDKGFGPYVQSIRQSNGIYLKYAKELVKNKKAYYCFCDKDRLEKIKTSVGSDGKEIVMYDKHCLSLTEEEINENLKAGKPYVIRVNIPNEGNTTFIDEIYGEITVPNNELDDMILIKSDGYPTYNFANVVDDHLMQITHVVRGNEYLSSAPKYNILYEAFGWDIPTYVHCPLITDTSHQKLSKRSGHSSYEDLINDGFLPEAVVNFVALLGWSSSLNQEIFTLDELVKEFDYRRINKSPAVFDINKMRWMNSEYIKKMDFDRFYEKAKPFIEGVLSSDLDFVEIAKLVQTRIETFSDIKDMISFFEKVEDYDSSLFINKKNKNDLDNSLILLKDIIPILKNTNDFSNDNLFNILSKYANEKEYKVGYVMWPIRIAVSGLGNTCAGATQIMSIIGKDESICRIEKAISKLS